MQDLCLMLTLVSPGPPCWELSFLLESIIWLVETRCFCLVEQYYSVQEKILIQKLKITMFENFEKSILNGEFRPRNDMRIPNLINDTLRLQILRGRGLAKLCSQSFTCPKVFDMNTNFENFDKQFNFWVSF